MGHSILIQLRLFAGVPLGYPVNVDSSLRILDILWGTIAVVHVSSFFKVLSFVTLQSRQVHPLFINSSKCYRL
jgi:hypothetical protein